MRRPATQLRLHCFKEQPACVRSLVSLADVIASTPDIRRRCEEDESAQITIAATIITDRATQATPRRRTRCKRPSPASARERRRRRLQEDPCASPTAPRGLCEGQYDHRIVEPEGP